MLIPSLSLSYYFSFFSISLFFLFGSIANAEPVPSLQNLNTISFHDGYTQLFGDSNLMLHHEGKRVHLSLDERTGSGFKSQDLYLHGFFSALIKLPSDYTAGVVVAFYMSNGDIYEKTHDELDFEFLGNIRGRDWRVQTNIYGNGSTAVGREERYSLWFDPTADFHRYSILWTKDRIVFYIDEIPIRELKKTKAMGSQFPSKPMSLYATIWDGSSWATSGGRYKVNYKYAPYIAEFTDLILHGCPTDTAYNGILTCGSPFESIRISADQRLDMSMFRRRYMTYAYCYDRIRYPVLPAECYVGHTASTEAEAELFLPSGKARANERRRHGKGRNRRGAADPHAAF